MWVIMTLPLTLAVGQGQRKYSNRKSIDDSLYDGNIYELFATQMCLTLTLQFRTAKFKYKCTDQKLMHDFIYDGNNNVCHIRHDLGDKCSRNVHDLDLTIKMMQSQMLISQSKART